MEKKQSLLDFPLMRISFVAIVLFISQTFFVVNAHGANRGTHIFITAPSAEPIDRATAVRVRVNIEYPGIFSTKIGDTAGGFWIPPSGGRWGGAYEKKLPRASTLEWEETDFAFIPSIPNIYLGCPLVIDLGRNGFRLGE